MKDKYLEAYQNSECYDEYIENLKDEFQVEKLDEEQLSEAELIWDEIDYKYNH